MEIDKNVLNAAVSIVAAAIPWIARLILKRKRASSSKNLLDLLSQLERLTTLQSTSQYSDITGLDQRIKAHIKQIQSQLSTPAVQSVNLTLFLYLTSIEGFVLFGSFFTWDITYTIISSFSADKNVYFLEGIFSLVFVKVLLVAVFVALSLYLTLKTTIRLRTFVTNNTWHNILSFAMFNLLFVAVTLSISWLLTWIDPFTRLW